MSKLLGIIGGMGTQATACFYQILHDLQSVAVEQEYIDVLLYSKPSIPDRTAYITGQSTESPLESLVNAAKILENAGVDCIAIPCATSHYFYDELQKAVSIPILNLLDETTRYAKTLGMKKVCLLATDGTLKSGIFHDAFKSHGIEVTTPAESVQADLMDMIYDIKRGEVVTADVLGGVVSKACGDGVDAVVLGCTELCVLDRAGAARQGDGSSQTINILQMLAEASIAFCKTVKE